MGDYPDFGIAKDVFQMGQVGGNLYVEQVFGQEVNPHESHYLVNVTGKGALLAWTCGIMDTSSYPSGNDHRFYVTVDRDFFPQAKFITMEMLYEYLCLREPILELPYAARYDTTSDNGYFNIVWVFNTPVRFTEKMFIKYENVGTEKVMLVYMVLYTKEE